jgi:hypothetical protein
MMHFPSRIVAQTRPNVNDRFIWVFTPGFLTECVFYDISIVLHYIPEEKHNLHKLEVEITMETVRRLNRLAVMLGKPHVDVIEAALLLYEDALNAVEVGSNRWCEMRIVGEE